MGRVEAARTEEDGWEEQEKPCKEGSRAVGRILNVDMVEHEIEAEVYGIQESIQVMQILLIKSRRDTWNQIRSEHGSQFNCPN
jgi:aspartate/tyrosine/aromatic aminotransferase